jgi:hypothetical protein
MENTNHREGYFLISLDNDRIGLEHYRTNGPSVEGEVVLVVNQKTLRRYSLHFREDGKIERLEFQDRAMDDQGALINSFSMHAQGDTIDFEFSSQGGKANKVTKTGSANIVGLGIPPFAMYEKLMATFRSKGGEGLGFITPQTDSLELELEQTGKREFQMRHPSIRTVTISVNALGELENVDGFGIAQLSLKAKRLDPAEGKIMMKRWLEDPALPLVSIGSPPQKVSFQIGNATISLAYGRPFKRGRKIFGGLVPYDKVWRTGADWATHIEFDKPLQIGDKTVEAGKYTLYTIPEPGNWQFLLNKQTGQWGVIYDEQQEMLRAAMETRKMPETFEQLVIAVEETSSGGVIVIRWDDVESRMRFDLT